jgi:YidC/Oxa1 family membrane protein insertase
MEKRMFIAAALSLGVLFLWEAFFLPKPPARKPPAVPTAAAPVAASTASAPAGETAAARMAPAEPVAPVAATSEQSVTLENPVVRATFSNRGGVMTSLVLKRYTDDQGRPLELVRQVAPPAPRPFSLRFPGRQDWSDREPGLLFAAESTDREIRFRWADASGSITKKIRLGQGYLFDVQVSVAGPPFDLFVGTGLRNPSEKEQGSRYILPAEAVATSGGSIAHVRSDKLAKPVSWTLDERGFAGVEDNYFLAVLMPRQRSGAEAIPVADKDAAGKPATIVATGISGSGALDARAYFGPKDVEILEGVGAGLERTVDFGWYSIVARPLLWLLKRVFSWVGNWGVSILLVTLLIRILLFPLMHKSYMSMKKMQKLAPKMNAIRDRYKKAKTDAAQRQKMNEELMKLYQAEGYNPMSGCFPMLLQLPILIAFYNVLSKTIELRHAPFVLWIKDLSAVDQTYILLILMIASMYVQQAMTPSTADPTQKKIFMAMPFIWGFFLKDMPSGLVLYWLFSNVLTILQQVIINRMSDKEEPEKPKRLKPARVKEAQG